MSFEVGLFLLSIVCLLAALAVLAVIIWGGKR